MENSDRENIERIIRLRKKAHTFYSGHSEVYRSFLEMEKNTFKDGNGNGRGTGDCISEIRDECAGVL